MPRPPIGLRPKALGYVLIAAGAAYGVDTVAHTALSNYRDFETLFLTIVALPSVLAEGWFGLRLVLRADKETHRQAGQD